MIYTMLKTTFTNTEPKLLKYRRYRNLLFDIFKYDLTENLINDRNSYDELILITYFRVNWINKPHERRSGFEVTLSLT